MADTEVLRLSPADWRTVRELRLAALRDAPEAFGGNYADSAARDEQQWRDWPAGGVVFAGQVDGRPAGMVAGVTGGSDPAVRQLISMWVSPAARGTGLATRLIDAVVDWAADSGAETLRLAVKPDNGRADRVYRRRGFRPVGVDEVGHLVLELPLHRTSTAP